MTYKIRDRVYETTTSTGTGALTLGGAPTGYQTFSTAIGDGHTCPVTIEHQTDGSWEVCVATVAVSGNTAISRAAPLASSNGGAAVDFAAGVKNVFVGLPATRAVMLDADGSATTLLALLGLTIGVNVQAYDADLDALAALSSTGMIARTGSGTVSARTITAGSNISVTNGNGVSGNPTIAATGLLPLAGGTMVGDIVLAGDPTLALHPATKQYVDNLAAGLDVKPSVKVATTANITLSGTQTIDGISAGVGDRVLVKDQSTASQNGIYVVASGSWSRATDMDAWTEVPGAMVIVEQGSTNGDKGYVCTADTGGTIGSTSITWSQFFASGGFQASDSDLDALAALSSTGLIARTGSGTAAVRSIAVPATGISISNADGVSGNPTLALANDLAALEGLGSTGLAARTAADTWAQRSIVAPAAGITVTDGNGVSGNPTLVLANDLAALEGLGSTGLAARTASDTWAQRTITAGNGITVSNGNGVSGNPTIGLSANASLPYFIDGGGATITTGIKGPGLVVPFDCTITEAWLLADQSGSIVIDIWKDTYANYPPTNADTITASAKPTITTATKSKDTTLTGWTVSLTKGDILRFNVDSVTSIQSVALHLQVLRTGA